MRTLEIVLLDVIFREDFLTLNILESLISINKLDFCEAEIFIL